MLFIYWFENHPRYADRMRQIRARMADRGDVLCASSLTFGEVMAGAVRDKNEALSATIRAIMHGQNVDLRPITSTTAEHFARIRAANRVSPPDALHLASAAEHGADVFLTHDRRLLSLTVPGIKFIVGMDAAIL